jgi:hypothetical protein
MRQSSFNSTTTIALFVFCHYATQVIAAESLHLNRPSRKLTIGLQWGHEQVAFGATNQEDLCFISF